MTAAQIAQKMLSIGACKEGRVWIEQGNFSDFRAGWKVCPAAEFMCWTLTRLMGLQGVKAAVACSKASVEHIAKNFPQLNDPVLKKTIALCEDVLEGRSRDHTKLQELAYDATAAALNNKKEHGSTLLSVGYAAYAVHFALLSVEETEPAKRMHALLKAAQHSSDAASHARHGMPKKSGLANLVRGVFSEEAVHKAWLAATPTTLPG